MMDRVLRVAETVVSVFAALLALFVVLYAGVFLSLYPAVPFLNSPLVPIVFVASALATGAAVLTIIGFFRFSRDETIGGFASLLRLDAVLVAIELSPLRRSSSFRSWATKLPLIRLLSCYRDILQCCLVGCRAGGDRGAAIGGCRMPALAQPFTVRRGGCEHAARRHLPAVLPSRGRRALLSRRHESAIVLDVASLSLRYVIL